MKVVKFTKINRFQTRFKDICNTFDNDFSKYFTANKQSIFDIHVSSNPHTSFNTIRSHKGYFDVLEYSSPLSSISYPFEEVMETYKELVREIVTPQTLMFCFDNPTVSRNDAEMDRMGEIMNQIGTRVPTIKTIIQSILSEDLSVTIMDVYLVEFLKAPNAHNPRINHLYFLSHFPLIMFLLDSKLKIDEPELFKKLHDPWESSISTTKDKLKPLVCPTDLNFSDNHDGEINSSELGDESSESGDESSELGDASSELGDASSEMSINSDSKVFVNSFLEYCSVITNPDVIEYNTRLLLSDDPRFENLIIGYPFLLADNSASKNSLTLKDACKRIFKLMPKIFNGSVYEQLRGEIVILDVKKLIEILKNEMESLEKVVMWNFLYFTGSSNHSLYLLYIFCIELYKRGIRKEMLEVYTHDELLSNLSTFVTDLYWVYKTIIQGKSEEEFDKIINSIDVAAIEVPDPLFPCRGQENFSKIKDIDAKIYKQEIYYYFTIVNHLFKYNNYLFKHNNFLQTVDKAVEKIKHLLFLNNFFKNNLKILYPIFLFGAFSDSQIKFIKEYEPKNNILLDCLMDIFDTQFKHAKKILL